MRIPRLAQLVLSVMLSAGIAITAIGPGASVAQGTIVKRSGRTSLGRQPVRDLDLG